MGPPYRRATLVWGHDLTPARISVTSATLCYKIFPQFLMKRMAATEALQWFYDNPQPPPPQAQEGTRKKVPDHGIDWDYIFEMALAGM